ncbi:MAG: ABC transporter substrate-binding protein [Chloroflexota bacterium]
MICLLHPFTVLLAAALVLTACGGQEIAQEAPEPTPAAEIISDEATADATSAPAEEESEETTDEAAAPESPAAASTTDFPVTVTDGDGGEHTFDAPPERVVCLIVACIENLAFLDVLPYAIDSSIYLIVIDPANFGEAGADVVQLPSGSDGPDFEAIAVAEPDLIIGGPDARPSTENIAPLYVPLFNPEATLEGAYHDVRMLATILGREAEAEEKLTALTDRIEAYDQLIPDDISIMVTFTLDLSELRLPGEDEFAYCWIDLIADCAASEIAGNSTLEALLAVNPDKLVFIDLLDTGQTENQLAQLAENPLWQELSAFQNNEIYVATPSTSRFTSPQAANGALEQLVPCLFPDIFPNGSPTDEEVQEILTQ